MSTQRRSDDLAADLLLDIASVETAPPAPPIAEPEPNAVVETAFFLDPRRWSRPRLTRAGQSVSVSAGPIRLRVGRG